MIIKFFPEMNWKLFWVIIALGIEWDASSSSLDGLWNCIFGKWISAEKWWMLTFYAIFSDVDTPEPDEKSIITYVSQLYDVFPEPPPGHPLFDVEAQKRLQQFRDLASSLHQWIKEQIVVMQVSTDEKMMYVN